jgi:hypothetical protein
MTKNSMILDMSENIMMVSKVVQNVIPTPPKKESMEFLFEHQDFNRRSIKLKISNDMKAYTEEAAIKPVKMNHLFKAQSMYNAAVDKDLSSFPSPTPEPISTEKDVSSMT